MFALVDCNSFYASCEQALNPKLVGRPVVVLSNNDGIVVARSQEAKDLGIEDLIVYFKVKDKIKKNNIHVCSSNYTLYGDMSARVMQTLLEFVPPEDLEIYSIDEAFLKLGTKTDIEYNLLSKKIASTVRKWVGIPVSVGVAPTKVLCKAANHVAKKYKLGVLEILKNENIDDVLKSVAIEKVWGIGRAYSTRLRIQGIETAYDLKRMNIKQARKMMTVQGEKIIMELNGISCSDLEVKPPQKKQIISSRSFGREVTTLRELKESIAMHCHIGAEKLRRDNLAAKNISVFIHSHWFKDNPFYNSAYLELPMHTNVTNAIIKHAHFVLDRIYKPGISYKKAGIVISDIVCADSMQLNLFGTGLQDVVTAELMDVVDEINEEYGRNAIHFAAMGTKQPWGMKMELRSPKYTTRWSDIPEAVT